MSRGFYLYGVASSQESVDFGNIGLDGKRVYSIPHKNIVAIVHDCEALAYSSDDKEVVKSWVVSHQAVVDAGWERFGVIVPVVFDTIIKGEKEVLEGWLSQNYESLASELKRLEGKAEYGVQVFWDVKEISRKIIEQDEELARLQKDIQSAPEGTAFLYKKKMEQILKTRLEGEASGVFNSIHDGVKDTADDVVIEKIKDTHEGRQMIVNISCLISMADEKRLGDLLDKINGGGLEIRFTGPWPPYSFVRRYGTNPF